MKILITLLVFASLSAQAADQVTYSECYYVALNAFKAYAREEMKPPNGAVSVKKLGATEFVAEAVDGRIAVNYVIKVATVSGANLSSTYDYVVKTERTIARRGRWSSCSLVRAKVRN